MGQTCAYLLKKKRSINFLN